MELTNICSSCENLRKELTKKEKYIKDLKSCLERLTDFLTNCSIMSRQKIIDETGFDITSSSNEINLSSISSNINFYILNTVNNTVVKSCSVDTQTTDDLTTANTEENLTNYSNLGDNEDYIFDENYQMYYSVSTGYYYDKERDLMYEPNSCIYYKYNYDKQEYQAIAADETLQTSSDYVSESVVNQVNNLNLNDDDSVNTKITICETAVSTKSEECTGILNSNICDTSQENDGTLPSKDWQIAEGSDMTITDMVKEVINECLSDYVYDETSKTYYSPSTGHVYNAETKLLYDPSTGAYYFYDEENQTYQYYCQAVPTPSTTNEESVEMKQKREKRLKTRKQFWKKKLNKAQDVTTPEVFKQVDKDCCEEFSSPEEGELFSSDEEDIKLSQPISIVRSPIKGATKQYEEMPSSIRAIVENAERLKIGSLILITCSGGIVGRERKHAICVPEVCVSKVHAQIKYNPETQEYTVEDLGSQNGTFVNEARLSEPKEKSLPHVLQHGDRLSLGSCKLLLHLHVGHETCDECEPGQVEAGQTSTLKDESLMMTKEEKEKLRRDTNRKLKMKYGLVGKSFQEKSKSALGYEDKAEIRRQAVGSDNPHEKTEHASVYSHMPKTNKGYMMLEKMGWKEGDSLGNKNNSGIPEPIPITPWIKKTGLGSSSATSTVPNISAGDAKRMKRWVKAQERYYSDAWPSVPLCNTKPDNIDDYP